MECCPGYVTAESTDRGSPPCSLTGILADVGFRKCHQEEQRGVDARLCTRGRRVRHDLVVMRLDPCADDGWRPVDREQGSQ